MSRMKSYNLLLGTSGTGKGTRVSQLLTFLETKFEGRPFYFIHNGKQRQLGLYFDDVGVFFIGQWTISNKSGLKSWTSLDYVNSVTGKTDLTIQTVKETAIGHVVGEGEPMLLSNKYRPLFMHEMYDISQMSFMIFDYATREEYDARILGRSGKIAGEGGWARNESYAKQPAKMMDELQQLQNDRCNVEFFVEKHNYDAPLTCWGETFLEFIGHGALVPEFLEFSKTSTTLRSVGETPKETKISAFDDWL